MVAPVADLSLQGAVEGLFEFLAVEHVVSFGQ
jgi:hypothetical protein